MQNTFGDVSFIVEVAVAAGGDPFEFRLKNLKDPRGAELLQALAELANWKPQTSRPTLVGDVARGRGLAFVEYELVHTYVGAVADVEVDLKTGNVTVTKFHVAHDCARIINPDGLRNQIERNVIQTVSRTLIEELTFDRSRVTSVAQASYPILKFPDVPDVAIRLMTAQQKSRGEPASQSQPLCQPRSPTPFTTQPAHGCVPCPSHPRKCRPCSSRLEDRAPSVSCPAVERDSFALTFLDQVTDAVERDRVDGA